MIAACAAISAQFAFGESVVSEAFEEGTLNSPIWSGSGGTIATADYDSDGITKPLPKADHTKVLNIAGDVVCAPSQSANANTIDLMVKLTAVDELETPDNPQVALAVAANGNKVDLKIYAKAEPNSEKPSWIALKGGLTPETWARLTLVFDYSAGTVSVCYNCEYVNKYYLINKNGNKINTLTFSGSTSIDDVVMTATAVADYNPYVDADGNAITNYVTVGKNETLGVSLNDLAKWGVSASALTTTTASDGSGMKIADKLVAGLTPTDGKKFELKTMTITDTSATLTFPGSASNDRYTIVATDKDKNPVDIGTPVFTDVDGGKKATVTIPDTPSVIYFKVQAKVKAAVPAPAN